MPISGAVLGDPQKGKTYGILAGISSLIFQLPLQLFILECHLLEQDDLKTKNQTIVIDEEQPSESEQLKDAPKEDMLPESA